MVLQPLLVVFSSEDDHHVLVRYESVDEGCFCLCRATRDFGPGAALVVGVEDPGGTVELERCEQPARSRNIDGVGRHALGKRNLGPVSAVFGDQQSCARVAVGACNDASVSDRLDSVDTVETRREQQCRVLFGEHQRRRSVLVLVRGGVCGWFCIGCGEVVLRRVRGFGGDGDRGGAALGGVVGHSSAGQQSNRRSDADHRSSGCPNPRPCRGTFGDERHGRRLDSAVGSGADSGAECCPQRIVTECFAGAGLVCGCCSLVHGSSAFLRLRSPRDAVLLTVPGRMFKASAISLSDRSA